MFFLFWISSFILPSSNIAEYQVSNISLGIRETDTSGGSGAPSLAKKMSGQINTFIRIISTLLELSHWYGIGKVRQIWQSPERLHRGDRSRILNTKEIRPS